MNFIAPLWCVQTQSNNSPYFEGFGPNVYEILHSLWEVAVLFRYIEPNKRSVVSNNMLTFNEDLCKHKIRHDGIYRLNHYDPSYRRHILGSVDTEHGSKASVNPLISMILKYKIRIRKWLLSEFVYSVQYWTALLGAFTKLRKAAISFFISVACPYGTTRLPLDVI